MKIRNLNTHLCKLKSLFQRETKIYNNSYDEPCHKFYKAALKDWWEVHGPVRYLHLLNEIRVPLVYNTFVPNEILNKSKLDKPDDEIKRLKVLVVGCGGGIFSEALSIVGFNVTAVEPNAALFEFARRHAESNPALKDKNIRYFHNTIEDFAKKYAKIYDAVVISEVIDQVADERKEMFLKSCIKTLKENNNNIFITTRNRTLYSWWMMLLCGYLGTLPKDAHIWSRFISPIKLKNILRKYGFTCRSVRGIYFISTRPEYLHCKDTSMWYYLHASKQSIL